MPLLILFTHSITKPEFLMDITPFPAPAEAGQAFPQGDGVKKGGIRILKQIIFLDGR